MRSSVSISFGLLDFSIRAKAPSRISFFQWPQFEPVGAKLKATNQRPIWETSEETRLMFIASAFIDWALVGALRKPTSMAPHSTTSNAMSKPHCFMLCCRNSFMGSGSICPEPLVEIMTLARTGRSGPYPASLSSALARSTSNR